jgi:hypothetical protein
MLLFPTFVWFIVIREMKKLFPEINLVQNKENIHCQG